MPRPDTDAVAPVLEPSYPLRTERLDLRPYRPGDLDDLRDMQGMAEVTRYLYTDELAYAMLADEWAALPSGVTRVAG